MSGDPITDIHWLQVVTTTYERRRDPVPEYTTVDNLGRRDNPYYDTAATANEERFRDRPRAADSISHVFLAELFLVQGPIGLGPDAHARAEHSVDVRDWRTAAGIAAAAPAEGQPLTGQGGLTS